MKWWMKIGISKKGGEFSPPYFKNFFWYILIYLVPSEKREPTNWMNWTAENLRSICQPHWMFLFHELNTHKARLARSVVHHLLHAPLPLGHPRRGLRDSQIWPKKWWESRCGKKNKKQSWGAVVNSCDQFFCLFEGSGTVINCTVKQWYRWSGTVIYWWYRWWRESPREAGLEVGSGESSTVFSLPEKPQERGYQVGKWHFLLGVSAYFQG